MTCTRCGADAAIKRDNAYYCGRCAVARDWGEIIALVQDGPRSSEKVVFEEEPVAEEPLSAAGNGSVADPFAS